MRIAVIVLAFSAALFASGADNARVPRAKVANVEKLINTQFAGMYPEEPYFLIGLARGTYLEGFGVVFSVEINLATGPSLSPFKQTISKEEIAKHREKKEARLPLLRDRMGFLVNSMSKYLDTLPDNEEFVLIVTLLRYPWETPGQPNQIIMRAQHGKLLQAEREKSRLDTVIKTQEF
jgi:hypothetical protein